MGGTGCGFIGAGITELLPGLLFTGLELFGIFMGDGIEAVGVGLAGWMPGKLLGSGGTLLGESGLLLGDRSGSVTPGTLGNPGVPLGWKGLLGVWPGKTAPPGEIAGAGIVAKATLSPPTDRSTSKT